MVNKLAGYSNAFFAELLKSHCDLSENQRNDLDLFRSQTELFSESGRKEDAFTVYFCYTEIFAPFGSGYANTKHMVELLSDHEHHAGELLTKHRDHYSHSAYVFVIGLALYAADSTYRRAFQHFYGLGEQDYLTFLRLWGLTALFHDVGYPFELAHDQIRDYDERMWGKGDDRVPFVSYGNMEAFDRLDANAVDPARVDTELKKACGSINGLLAYGVACRMGYHAATVADTLCRCATHQPRFMDHAYFSAALLTRQIFDKNPGSFSMELLDVLSAILLHNSLNKPDKSEMKKRVDLKPVAREDHPLAYLLILCDELQCWDRQAFGLTSRKDPLAWSAEFAVEDNEIRVTYLFESSEVLVPGGTENRENNNYKEIQGTGQEEKIMSYIRSDLILITDTRIEKKDRQTFNYASEDTFVNLCDFAESIHENYRRQYQDKPFEELDLGMKLSNVEQAKSYAYKLELINCFYSHKELDYPVVENFRRDNVDPYDGRMRDDLGFLSREEHVRWVRERLRGGWQYGTDYVDMEILGEDGKPLPKDEEKKKRKQIRNERKQHKDLVPYDVLLTEDRKKDENAVNYMIPLLYQHGNCIRIYRYRYGRKPNLEVGGTGHVYLDPAKTEDYKAGIKKLLRGFQEKYRVIVRTCFAPGADLLIAECAGELGITTKAILPMNYDACKRYLQAHPEAILNINDDVRETYLRAHPERELPAGENEQVEYLKGHPEIALSIFDDAFDRYQETQSNALLPIAYEAYVQYQREQIKGFDAASELRMRHLLAQTAVCRLPKEKCSKENPWLAATRDLADKSDKLIMLWDEKEVPLEDENGQPINRGSTYHCMQLARTRSRKPLNYDPDEAEATDIFVIHCDKVK